MRNAKQSNPKGPQMSDRNVKLDTQLDYFGIMAAPVISVE